ncbi:oxidoreductase [Subtercola sp. Z020]|uniref:oxidoreductase n=1 Tax=Subtercola sp. Z020 TaxID=2080582 RepID=UPI000CE82981|nr:oxidoreductase [Subtercola sp. Z020]PPF89553.1 oxidoreductase [Subtercola sp. Z020]
MAENRTPPGDRRSPSGRPPTVAVVGPGAIGTTIAALLHRAGQTPLLYGRTPRPCVTLHDDEGSVTVPGPVRTRPEQAEGPVDLVFLAVKTTQVEAAAVWLGALCHPGTVVCVLQNGVEQLASVTPHAAGAAVVPAVVWFPATTQPDGSVRLRASARLTLPDLPASRVVVAALEQTACSVELAPHFRAVAWRKLLQNAVAGLMVPARRRSGMFVRDDIAELAERYLREGLAVARAEGAELGDETVGEIIRYFRANPADLGTSILTDSQAGRPLEWDTRNGIIRRRGLAHGIPTPVSDVLVPLLAASSDGPG